jgi:hypothetical protein
MGAAGGVATAAQVDWRETTPPPEDQEVRRGAKAGTYQVQAIGPGLILDPFN